MVNEDGDVPRPCACNNITLEATDLVSATAPSPGPYSQIPGLTNINSIAGHSQLTKGAPIKAQLSIRHASAPQTNNHSVSRTPSAPPVHARHSPCRTTSLSPPSQTEYPQPARPRSATALPHGRWRTSSSESTRSASCVPSLAASVRKTPMRRTYRESYL